MKGTTRKIGGMEQGSIGTRTEDAIVESTRMIDPMGVAHSKPQMEVFYMMGSGTWESSQTDDEEKSRISSARPIRLLSPDYNSSLKFYTSLGPASRRRTLLWSLYDSHFDAAKSRTRLYVDRTGSRKRPAPLSY